MALMFVDLLSRLVLPNVIIGIILCSIGFGLVLISRKLARIFNDDEELREDNHFYLICRGMGLTMICVALVIMILY